MKSIRLVVPLLLAATPALAHTGHEASGFASGFAHPFGGADHLLAMVAVGLAAALRGRAALAAWPAAFIGGMIGGFGAALAGIGAPAVEFAIAASVVALGLAIALQPSLPLAIGAAALALFGAAHGHAHGAEITGGAAPFAAGFVLATAALHGAGLALGLKAMRLAEGWPLRVGGAAVALAGLGIGLA